MTPEQILERMARTYAECKTYRDSGSVTTRYVAADGEWTDHRPFSTAFVRPDRFRYEFREQDEGELERYLVWRHGARVRTWWDVNPGIEEVESLERALAAATGVSGGSAQTVPGYLMPSEVKPWRMNELRDLRRLEDARIADLDCYRIAGTRGWRATTVTLWIDARSALLRRIEERSRFEPWSTDEDEVESLEERRLLDTSPALRRRIRELSHVASRWEATMEYEPAIDEPIPESQLLFDPPRQGDRK